MDLTEGFSSRWDGLSPSQRARFKGYMLRGAALLLAGLVMELAVPVALLLAGQPASSCNNCTLNTTSSSLSPQGQALVDGVVVLWNGVGVALLVLAVSAFYLARSVWREKPGGQAGGATTIEPQPVAAPASRGKKSRFASVVWVRCPECGKPCDWPSETCQRCGSSLKPFYR